MKESQFKENIEWVVELYRKLKPKPYSSMLIFAGVTILIGPGWWQEIFSRFFLWLFSEHISPGVGSDAPGSVFVGFSLIVIGLVWDLLLRFFDSGAVVDEKAKSVEEIIKEKELSESLKWKPIIHKVLHLVERSEGWLYVGFKNLSTPSQENFGVAAHSYKMLKRHLEELNNSVATLRAESAPEFIDIVSTINHLFIKMEFLIKMYQDFNESADYVMHSPRNELAELTDKLLKSAADHDYKVKTEGTDPNLRRDTFLAWEDFCENNPIFDKPSEFKASIKRILIIFDVKTMQEITTLEPGMKLQIFITD